MNYLNGVGNVYEGLSKLMLCMPAASDNAVSLSLFYTFFTMNI